MWILNQVGDLSINTKNVNYIAINKQTNSLFAALMVPEGEKSKVNLGAYNSLDDCRKILEVITVGTSCDFALTMPVKSEVEDWVKETSKQTVGGIIAKLK